MAALFAGHGGLETVEEYNRGDIKAVITELMAPFAVKATSASEWS